MARWRVVGFAFLGVIVLLLAAITLTIGWRPFLGPRARIVTDQRFESTPERLERGRYIANNLTGCVGCHSPNDRNNHNFPVYGQMASGRTFENEGPPWLTAPNLTPDKERGAGDWSGRFDRARDSRRHRS